jgi:hypothetical protein
VFVLSVSPIGFEEDAGRNLMQYVTCTVANHGRTPAIIEGLWIGSNVDPYSPQSPMLADDANSLLISSILAAGERREGIRYYFPSGMDWKGEYDPETPYPEGEDYPDYFVPAIEDNEDLFFWIRIVYRGAFTSGHETSSCWRYNRTTRRFGQHGGAEFNYLR